MGMPDVEHPPLPLMVGSPPLLGVLTRTHKAIATIKRQLYDDIQLGITAQLDSAPSGIADKGMLGQESFLRQ